MIGRLHGVVVEKNPPLVLIDVGGVAYEVSVPMSTFYHLPATGERALLVTHLIVREDAHLLFGFLTESERSAFRQLLSVNGVGPKVALGVLSGLSVQDLAQAIALQDSARLTKIPGIGKKTAERVLLELKGKLVPLAASGAAQAGRGSSHDVLTALVALGYQEREAAAALKQLPQDVEVADGIRQALRLLSKAS